MYNTRRIVHVVTVPETLGFFDGQFRFLQDNGFDVFVACSSCTQLKSFALKENVRPIHVDMTRGLDPARTARAWLSLYNHFREMRPAIVHAHTPKAGLLAVTAADAAGVPIRYYTVHGLPFVTTRGAIRRLLIESERIATRRATRTLAVSESVRVELLNQCGVNATVLANGSINGVNAHRFDPKRLAPEREIVRCELEISRDAFLVMFVGRFAVDKGLDLLAAAWDTLTQLGSNAHLCIVGDLDSRAPVTSEVADKLFRSERCRVVNWTNQIERYYAAADAIVLPSRREGFPVTVLEAAAMSLPAIGTDVLGVRDAIVNGVTGRLVSLNADAVAEAVLAYECDRASARKHGLAARERVLRDYVPTQIWSLLLNTYEQDLSAGIPHTTTSVSYV